MKKFLPAAIAAIFCAGFAVCFTAVSRAEDAKPPAAAADKAGGDIAAETEALSNKVDAKLEQGKNTEADFVDEMKECDTILAAHKDEKTDEVANVVCIKIQLYMVFENDDKATELLKMARNDYPDTALGMRAGRLIKELARDAENKKIQKTLVAGADFPDFDEKDLDGKPVSVANYKGKVVLVDFWATWCVPCIGELPNVMKTYEKYHDKGFEIIGVSLDIDQDSLAAFFKEKNMPWPEFYDGLRFQNKVALKYGVGAIPTNILVGKDGKIIDKDLRGPALDDAVGKALGQ